MKRSIEEVLLSPPPNGTIAEASEYGIDLTQMVENLGLTPEERLEKLQQGMICLGDLKRSAKRVKV